MLVMQCLNSFSDASCQKWSEVGMRVTLVCIIITLAPTVNNTCLLCSYWTPKVKVKSEQ